MKISSPAFEHNQLIPAKYTCDGENITPPLSILNVPANAKTLVLIVDDPDAPAGDWVHWLVWNINPATTEINEGKKPEEATEGTTDFGKPGWGGPCPPGGTHRYQFKLYALDKILSLPVTTRKADLQAAMSAHIIDQSILIGMYKRK